MKFFFFHGQVALAAVEIEERNANQKKKQKQKKVGEFCAPFFGPRRRSIKIGRRYANRMQIAGISHANRMQIALLTLNRIVFKKHIKKEEKKRNKTKPTAFPPRRKRHRPDE